MTTRIQKFVSTALVAIAAAGSLNALIKIVNLNQVTIFLEAALAVWLYLWLMIVFLYDLHFRSRNVFTAARLRHQSAPHWFLRTVRVCADACYDRCRHLLVWKEYSKALNYLLLPGFLFWGTVMVLFMELGHVRTQSAIAALTTAALAVNYFYIKEVFSRNKERVDPDVFIALSVVKIYAVALVFGGTLALMRSYCLDPQIFLAAIFCISFLFIYQALSQHALLNLKNTGITLVIAAVCGIAGYGIYIFWSYNFFTAAVFFAAIYNLLWGAFHYHLDQALTWKAFREIALFCFIAAAMVFSTTNFKARILDDCPAVWMQ